MTWLTIKLAAEYLHVSEQTLRRWMLQGLPSYQAVKGGKRLIKTEDADRWIQNRGA